MVIVPIQGVFKIIHTHSYDVIFNQIIFALFFKSGTTAQHHNKPFKMENVFDIDAFCNFDLNMPFAENENV